MERDYRYPSMNVIMSGQRIRYRMRLLAGILASAAQVLLGTAALGEARFGPDAGAHVESAGTSVHHAHDEANCVACVSQHILAGAEPSSASDLLVVESAARPRSIVRDADSRVPRFFSKPRAPPTIPV
jgi:hypothetical protein